MAKIDRPSANSMIDRLDLNHAAGVNTKLKGVSTTKGSVYHFLMSVKERHPTKVVLVRVGDFYETWGYDAVILVQFAGLNPMGNSLPRAGCPKQNIQRTLDDLTANGFGVVVCEEVPVPYSYGSRTQRRQRFISSIITAHSPQYVYNLALQDTGGPDFRPTPPICAVSMTTSGVTLRCANVDLRQVTIYEAITEDVAIALISAAGFSPPLYVHNSLSKGNSVIGDGKMLRFLEGAAVNRYSGDSGREFMRLLRHDLGLDESTTFTDVASSGLVPSLHAVAYSIP
jgi:hypothetical protein